MKRIFYICLILLLGIGLMAGCNKTEEDPTDPGTTSNGQNSQTDNNAKVDDKTIKELIAKGERVTECTYDLVYTEGSIVKLRSKCYYRNLEFPILRSEPQGNSNIYLIDMDIVTEFSPVTKTGRFIIFDDYDSKDTETPNSFINRYMAYEDFTYESTETYDGVECYVLTINDPDGIYKVWLHSTIGLFIKIDGGVDMYEYKNLKTGSGIVPDSLMRVPIDVVVEESGF